LDGGEAIDHPLDGLAGCDRNSPTELVGF